MILLGLLMNVQDYQLLCASVKRKVARFVLRLHDCVMFHT